MGCCQTRNPLTPKQGGIGSRWQAEPGPGYTCCHFRTQWEGTGAKGHEYLTFPKETVNLFLVSFCVGGESEQVEDTQDNSRSLASTVMINNKTRETQGKEKPH